MHTPGPWFASPAGKNWWITTDQGLDEVVAELMGSTFKGEPREANARLIAAAPKMLWALKDALAFLQRSGYDTQLVKGVIAEAEAPCTSK